MLCHWHIHFTSLDCLWYLVITYNCLAKWINPWSIVAVSSGYCWFPKRLQQELFLSLFGHTVRSHWPVSPGPRKHVPLDTSLHHNTWQGTTCCPRLQSSGRGDLEAPRSSVHKAHKRQCHIHVHICLYTLYHYVHIYTWLYELYVHGHMYTSTCCMHHHVCIHSIPINPIILLYQHRTLVSHVVTCCHIRKAQPFHWVVQRDIAGARSDRPITKNDSDMLDKNDMLALWRRKLGISKFLNIREFVNVC